MAVAFVQQKIVFSTTFDANITATLDSPSTVNNLLVAVVALRGHGTSESFVTPAGWTKLYEQGVAGENQAAFWRVGAGNDTIFFNWTGTAEPCIGVYEFSGLDSVAPLDVLNTTTAINTTARNAGPLTPTASPGMAFTSIAGTINANSVTITSPSGFTPLSGRSSGTFNPLARAGFQAYSTLDAITAPWSLSTACEVSSILAFFKEPAVGGAPTITALTPTTLGATSHRPRFTYTA